jgi:hypothetical protein
MSYIVSVMLLPEVESLAAARCLSICVHWLCSNEGVASIGGSLNDIHTWGETGHEIPLVTSH